MLHLLIELGTDVMFTKIDWRITKLSGESGCSSP